MGNCPFTTPFASILLSCYDFCLTDSAADEKRRLLDPEDDVSMSSVESEHISLKSYLRYKDIICRNADAPFHCQNDDEDAWGAHLVFSSGGIRTYQAH